MTFSDQPFARAMKLLKKGDINSMVQLANTPERTQFIDFIGPYYDEKLLLVTTAEVEQNINLLTDLIKLPGRIGMQRGIFISEAFDEILSQNDALQRKISAMINPSLHIEMVRKQRLSGFFVEQNHFNYLAATREGYESLKVQPIQLSHQPVFYGFSKAAYSAEKLAQIKSMFDANTAQINTILSNYGITRSIQ